MAIQENLPNTAPVIYAEPLWLERLSILGKSGLRGVVAAESHATRVGQFVATYQERAQYPWLHESGSYSVEGNGLTGAFRYALGIYRPGYTEPATPGRTVAPVELSEWRDKLNKSVDVLDDTAFRSLGHGLWRLGLDMDAIDEHTLAPHLVEALDSYVATGDQHLSSDPW